MRPKVLVGVLLLTLAITVSKDTYWALYSVPIRNVSLHIEAIGPQLQYFLKVAFGLHDACDSFHQIDTQRGEAEIDVSLSYRTHSGTCQWWEERPFGAASLVPLGSDIEPDKTYTARVNGEPWRFTAGLDAMEATAVSASIQDVSVHRDDSDPPTYSVDLKYYVPLVCNTKETSNVHLSGTMIQVSLMLGMVDSSGDCAGGPALLKTSSIVLGSDFDPRTTYIVRVNDWETFFRAGPLRSVGSSESSTLDPVDQPGRQESPYFARVHQPDPRQFPPLMAGEAIIPISSPRETGVRATESSPPSYILDTIIAEFTDPTLRRVDIRRSDNRIEIRPVGQAPKPPYGGMFIEYYLSIDLGSTFEPGTTYFVYFQGEIVAKFTAE